MLRTPDLLASTLHKLTVVRGSRLLELTWHNCWAAAHNLSHKLRLKLWQN